MMNENEERAIATLVGAFVGWTQRANRNSIRTLSLEDKVDDFIADPILGYLRQQRAADLLAGIGFDGGECCDPVHAPTEDQLRAWRSYPVVSTTQQLNGLPGTIGTRRVIAGELYTLGRILNVPSVRAGLAGMQVNEMTPAGRVQFYRAMNEMAKAAAKQASDVNASGKDMPAASYRRAWEGFFGGVVGPEGTNALGTDLGVPSATVSVGTSGVITASAGLGTGSAALFLVSSSPAERNTLSSFNLRLSPTGTPASGEQARIAVPAGASINFAVDVELSFGMSTNGGNIDGVKPYAYPVYSGGLLSYILVGVGTALTASTVYDLLLKVGPKT